MKWNTIPKGENPKNYLPKEDVFIALWKGSICLAEYSEDEGRFYIMLYPAQYSQSWCIAQERECKFTHWMELPKLPEDY